MIPEPSIIQFFGRAVAVNCDRQCAKAWGIQLRPKSQLSADPDDYASLADDELGEAPADPGTYEGGYGKPASPTQFPTKWCVRQCERCAMGAPGVPLALPDFSVRRKNIADA